MELLLDWLNSEVKLSEKITDVDSQFSNGYLFSELLQKYNQILDNKLFKNKDSKNSIVKNFSQLERVFRRLGVNFNLTQAIQIKNKEKGVAVQLLRVLKDVLEKTEGLVDFQILTKTGHKNLTFPVSKIDFSKAKYEEIQNKIFQTRLYNTIPEQQESNLQRKNRKFVLMQDKIREMKLAEKQRLENENIKQKVYMRQMLLSQLERKKNYEKEWTAICEEQFQKNQKVTQNRKNFEKMFHKKKKLDEFEKNNQKKVPNNTQLVVQDIKEFEENKTRMLISETQNETGNSLHYNLARDIVKKVSKDSDVYQIIDEIKSRENEHQKDKSKKERDRRLRKMIVDLKRDRLTNNFNEIQQIMKESINQNSQNEEILLDTFASIQKYQDIFIDNLALFKDMQWEKYQQEEINREKQSQYEKQLEAKKIESSQMNQLQLYSKEIEMTEVKKYQQKYRVMELLSQEIVEDNFEYAYECESSISFNENTNQKILQKLLLKDNPRNDSYQNQSEDRLVKYLSQFKGDSLFWEEFNKAIYSTYLSSFQSRKLEKPSFEYLDVRVLLIGMPSTDQAYLASYLANLLNIKNFEIDKQIETLFVKKDIQELDSLENNILEKLFKGQEVSYSMEVSYLISILDKTFGRYLLEDKVKNLNLVTDSENPLLLQKLQSVGEETNKELTKKIEKAKSKEQENWDQLETIKNVKKDAVQKEVSQVIVEEEVIETSKVHSSTQQDNKIQSSFVLQIDEGQNISQKIFEDRGADDQMEQQDDDQKTQILQETEKQGELKQTEEVQGVILSLESLEKVKFFEEQISFLKPENTLQLNDLQKLNQIINMVYNQRIPLEKEQQKVFFDTVFILRKNPGEIIKEVMNYKENLQMADRFTSLFSHQEINKRDHELQQVKSFYQGYLNRDNQNHVHELFINENFPEIIDSIQKKILHVMADKKKLKMEIKQKSKESQTEYESQKQLQIKLEEEQRENKILFIEEWKEIVSQKIQSNNSNDYLSKNVEIFKFLLFQYKEVVTNIIEKQKNISSHLKKSLYDATTIVTQQANVSSKMNVLLQGYIKVYNSFYKQNKEVLENEQIQEELFMRCYEFSDQLELLLQESHLSLVDSYKTSLDASFFANLKFSQNQTFFQLLSEEINKFLGEKDILNAITKSESIPAQPENDAKNKNKPKEEAPAQTFELCDIQNLVEEIKVAISQSNSSDKHVQTIIDLLREKVISMIQNEDFFNQNGGNQKQGKNAPPKVAKVAEQEVQNETFKRMKEELVQKALVLIGNYQDDLEEIENSSKTTSLCVHSVLQSSFNKFQQCIKILIDKLSLFITNCAPIKRALFIRNYQIVEEFKKLQSPIEIEEKMEIVEVSNYFSSLGFEDLVTLQKLLQQNADFMGKLSKKRIREIMERIRRGQIDEIQLSEKWLRLGDENFEFLINNFTDYEDSSQIMFKVFFINILLEEFTIPSPGLFEFYKKFSMRNSIESLEKFLTIKLFFEYDENNKVIEDVQKKLKFKFIKERMFELLFDEDEGKLKLGDLVDYFNYLYELFDDIKGKTYFQVMTEIK